ncbi:MAG: holo-ACP synthase [Armatimonadetes bacterium]|nr:holo-ACP synthase [Armatimonadota bacterium]
MLLGLGIDIVEVDRIARLVQRKPEFPERILTPSEFEFYVRSLRHDAFLAGRWAAKEAAIKAWGAPLSFQEISILPDGNGRPCLAFSGRAEGAAGQISISHDARTAVAVCILTARQD